MLVSVGLTWYEVITADFYGTWGAVAEFIHREDVVLQSEHKYTHTHHIKYF